MTSMKRNTKIIIGIVVAAAVVAGVGLTVLLPKTPDIHIGDWWEYIDSDGNIYREEVVGEEMVGEHDCWKIKLYSPHENSNFEVSSYFYKDKKNLGVWKGEIVVRYEIYPMKDEISGIETFHPEPDGIKWPIEDRSYDTTRTSTVDGKKNSFVVSNYQTYIGKEEITVPAGTFVCEHYKETSETGYMESPSEYDIWFSTDVWNVVRKVNNATGWSLELVDYHRAK